jgi:hypothetical protein
MTQSRHYIACSSFDQCLPLIAVLRAFMALAEGFSVNCAKLGEGRVFRRLSRDRLAKHGEGAVAILRRAEHARSGELHGTVAYTVQAVAQ